MLVYHDESLVPIGYTNADFQSDRESKKSTSGYVFTLGGGSISRSVKQSNIADSTMEAEYITASEAAKEAVVGFVDCKTCFSLMHVSVVCLN